MIRKLMIFTIAFLFQYICVASAAENYVLSEPQIYTIVQRETVSNTSKQDYPELTVKITLMDTEQPPYQVFLGEEFEPKPQEIYRNSNGTRFGIWKIKNLKAGRKVILVQKYAVRNFSIEFQLDSNAGLGKYRNVAMRYLLPEPKIEVDSPEILSYANEVVGQKTNPYDISRALFADINQRLTYSPPPSKNANKGALNALRSGEGVCDDYAALFVASARSVGVPARWTAGYLYQPQVREKNEILSDGSINLIPLRHAWPEFMLPRVGWVVTDPTYTYTVNGVKTVDYTKFARIDSTDRHIFLGYENSRLELSDRRVKVDFAESLQFGKKIVQFPDIFQHWAKNDIMYLSDYPTKIIGGYTDGSFRPDNNITRSQVAAMLNRALGLDYDIDAKNFIDVTNKYWAYNDILALKYNGITGGYADGKFLPAANITRAELAVMLSRSFDFTAGGINKNFVDLQQEKYAWVRNSVDILAHNGIIGGYSDGEFKPEKEVTRAELAVFLTRILNPEKRLK